MLLSSVFFFMFHLIAAFCHYILIALADVSFRLIVQKSDCNDLAFGVVNKKKLISLIIQRKYFAIPLVKLVKGVVIQSTHSSSISSGD